jgi:hypothetical protein
MAIKFGDILENQNSDYPIVDVVGDNVAGIHIVDDFANDHLIDIPANARRTGSIVVAKDTGKAYIFIGTGSDIAGNNDSGNEWGHAAGTNWIPAGSTTLGSPSSGNLTDNSPAITSFTTNTLIVDAIDQLNETLGNLVPTAPTAWTTFENDLTASVFGVQASANARLTPKDSGGTNITHATNNSGATYSAGSGSNTVNWDTATSINAEFSPGSDGLGNDNDLAPTILTFRQNDESVTLDSTSATSATLSSGDNAYGGAITLAVTYGAFPTTGDSAGFYSGIDKVELDIATTLSSGFNKFTLEDASNNGISNTIYRASSSSSISVTAVGAATDAGDNIYMSGQKFWTRPTYKPTTVSATTIIPSAGLVYGATASTSDNDFLTFTAGDIFPALASKSYTDINGVTSVDDLRLNQSASFTGSDFSSVTANAGQKGFKDLNSSSNSNVPKANGKSIHGNDDSNRVIAAGANYAFWDKASVAQSLANLYPYEDDLYTDLHSSDDEGERVVDPDAGGTYVDNPSDAASAYTLWSPQYGNNTSGSLSLDAQDAITCINSAGTSLECAHELRNFTSGYTFAASAQNFSGRVTGTAQYVTYRFPINGTSVATVYLKFEGDLDGGGDVFIKMFDGAGATNLEGANSATGGWVKATANATELNSNSVPIGGCASGTPLSKTSTSLQTVALNAGGTRWEDGSDNFIYVRVKLQAGDYVRKIGLCATA